MSETIIQSRHGIIGRVDSTADLQACLLMGRNALIEGPVGVGKTRLAKAVAAESGRGFVRVDGDGRYTEAKLVGHFDPPGVLEHGYTPELFVPGPLVRALTEGSVLFINELNRMPEGVQNVLLPALDEGCIQVPRLGPVEAAPGFVVIATQNPAEFVATGQLAEALLDRFELVELGWQSEDEEIRIVRGEARSRPSTEVIEAAVRLVRATRDDPAFRRGASVRAAVAIADIATAFDGDITRAAKLALPTRVELADGSGRSVKEVIDELQKKSLQIQDSLTSG